MTQLTKEEIEMIKGKAEEFACIEYPFARHYWVAVSAYIAAYTKVLLQLKAERERAEYWSKRCLAAENCLDKSPCDPDITKDQIEAHRNWEAAKKNEYKNK
jgi:hypothetical protein